MKINYTNEKNIQMLIFLLKAHNIKKIIISPGAMNVTFTASVQNDPYFEIYSCVDERSACYMACGLAAESGEPVVISCTGATASRNYMPGLTEAYYRKLPILAVTASAHLGRNGHNIPQMLDRGNTPNDIAKLSVQIPSIHCSEDEWNCNILLNKALLELNHHGSGPVHINLGTTVSKIFNVTELPKFRKINRIEYNNQFPSIAKNINIAIFVGAHQSWNSNLQQAVDEFCEKYNAVVICDHTSNYHGKYKILANLLLDQDSYNTTLKNIDLLIHLGDVSGAYMNINPKTVWRVNPDGEIRDTFKKLAYVFEMEELDFFTKYNQQGNYQKETSNFNKWQNEIYELQTLSNNHNFPFSNIWLAQNTLKQLPNNCVLHLAILNSLRSWNYFDTNKNINIYSNTGGFGIDGIMSTLIGASLYNPNKIYYGIIGDLAFFYDLNSLGNRHIQNNIRIMLINNGCGTEFHNYSHHASVLGDDMISKFIGADGHYAKKSKSLVKNFAENLGFEYLSASNKEEFKNNINHFTSNETNNKPIVFEIFTNSEDESNALKQIRNLKTSIKETIKNNIKEVLSENTKAKIKKVLGKN